VWHDLVRLALEQRVFLYDTYVKYGSAGKYGRKSRRKFRDEKYPAGKPFIIWWINLRRITGLLIDKKPKHKRGALTEEKLDDIGARVESKPRKSLKRLAQETGV
jgi:hypothetical protein